VTSRGSNKIYRWLVKGLVLIAAIWLVVILMGWGLRQIAFTQIAELTNTKIQAKSVNFKLNGSVFIKELTVKPHKKHSYDDAVLKAEIVYARFGLGSLLLLRPRLKEINLNNFLFNAQYDLDTQRWNLPSFKLKAPKGGPGKMPVIHLENGMLQFSNVSKGQVKAVAALPIDVRFGPVEKSHGTYSFDIKAAGTAGTKESVLEGTFEPGEITIAGRIPSTSVPAFERVWSLYALAAVLNYDRDNNYSLTLKIHDLFGKPATAGDTFALDKLPFLNKFGQLTALQEFFNQYNLLGRLDVDLEASGNLRQLKKSKIEGRVYSKDISIRNRSFPYLVENLRMGGAGTADPVANMLPEYVVAVYNAFKAGDQAKAEAANTHLKALRAITASAANATHAAIKEVMRARGLPIEAIVKPPLPSLTAEQRTAIWEQVEAAGLVNTA